ncbi:MAG: hypothetical protein F4X07_03875 [Acidimicrobiaceae bacterium]|nr:hypothetical protein [Acidimicrobiaceae bacterium]
MRLELRSVRSPAGWLGLLVCMVAGSLITAAPASGVAGYGDVADGAYFTEPVQWSADNDITGIDGACFLPDAAVSRGEAAVYIWNMEGRPSAPAHSFVDITNDAQGAAVSWMSHSGITTGTTATTFAPDTTLTRAHLVTFLHRLAGKPEAPAHPFVDVFASWQQAGVSWASHTQITTGTSPTTFEPDKTLTRAHLVTFLYRYKGEPTVTVDPDTPACDPAGAEEPTDTNRVFTAVSAGSNHSCAVDTNNKVECWGENDYGQANSPRGEFTTVSAGYDHSCAVNTNNKIECWGENHVGEADAPDGEFTTVSTAAFHSCGILTNGTIECWGENNPSGRTDAPSGEFTAVSTGGNHSCAIGTDQKIECWGSWGTDSPVDPPAGDFTAISVGISHLCGVRTNGTIECWGENNPSGRTDAPFGEFTTVSVGVGHSCAVDTDNKVECWGSNGNGQSDAPGGDFTTVSAGSNHSCAISTNGKIECWGPNYHGQADAPFGEFTTVSAGSDHTCALSINGEIECWGRNNSGQTNAPDGEFTTVSAGTDHSCAVDTNDRIICWGSGGTDVPHGEFTTVSAGFGHTCALDSNNRIECWGWNYRGKTDAPNGEFTTVSAGSYHSCGVRTNGKIECWGWNNSGQTNVPDGEFTTVSAGLHHSCAISTNGAIECWGNNYSGQTDAPDGEFATVSVGPHHSCAISTSNQAECWPYHWNGRADAPAGEFATVSAGGHHSCGVRTNGTIECWGANSNGRAEPPPSYEPSGTAPQATSVPASGPNVIQAVYVVPSDKNPLEGQDAAIAHEIEVVQSWFRAQTGGTHPVFARDGDSISVTTVRLPGSLEQFDTVARILDEIGAAADQPLLLVVEGRLGTATDACGWASRRVVVIPIDNCSIRPLRNAVWPRGGTYLLGHELTHLLGAVPPCAPNYDGTWHVDDDRRDVLYNGPEGRDWDNLMLDPGNDDYYMHGRDDCFDIADSPLLGSD